MNPFLSDTENIPSLITAEQIKSLREETILLLYNRKVPDCDFTEEVVVTYTFSYLIANRMHRGLNKAVVDTRLFPTRHYYSGTLEKLKELASKYRPLISRVDDYTQVIKVVTTYHLSPLTLVKLLSEYK